MRVVSRPRGRRSERRESHHDRFHSPYDDVTPSFDHHDDGARARHHYHIARDAHHGADEHADDRANDTDHGEVDTHHSAQEHADHRVHDADDRSRDHDDGLQLHAVGSRDLLLSIMNFEMWGLSGSLATERDDQMAFATQRLWSRLESFDVACNRFRDDSELSHLNATPGVVTEISETLSLALDAALRAADVTDGLCDPTVLPSLLALGYDRDFDELTTRVNAPAASAIRPLGTRAIHLHREHLTVMLDAPCQLDLGASAKALVVDLIANDVAPSGGVVVELGGDVAVRGNGPQGPWAIGVSDSLSVTGREPRISLRHGGVATSSTMSRTWRAGDEVVNHIIDPRTGSFAHGTYATASVTASDCVLANAFATAALLWNEEAAYHIAQAGWSARLVRTNGTVEFVGGWPEDTEATR